MASGWAKSLPCKPNDTADVATRRRHHHPSLPPRAPPKPPPLPSSSHKTNKKPSLFPPLGCGNTSRAVKDVVVLFPKPPPADTNKPSSSLDRPTKSTPSPALPDGPSSFFPTLTEIPAGHSSRRVVEIIFSSSWSRTGIQEPFPGEIEILFKVQNPARTVARFEEYRDTVRSRAGPDDARCAADGNEMMRFHCAPAGPATTTAVGDPIYVAGVVCSSSYGSGIRTFSGSGGAHDSSGGAHGFRRRAMIVCRVIAGRIRTGSNKEFESVWVGEGERELLVFDPRAVLPCFLIIYKV